MSEDNQPTAPAAGPLRPSASTVSSAAIGVPLGVVLTYVANQVLIGIGQHEMPAEIAAAFGSLVGAIAGFFFPGGRSQDVA